MNRYVIFLASALALSLFTSCDSSSNSTTPPPTYGGNTFPKTGSTYNYDFYQTDSNGNNIENTYQQQTASVVADNQTYKGKSKVFQVADNGANNYYTYEQNGDVDIYLDQSAFGAVATFLGESFFSQWYLLPTASKLKGLILYDTTQTIDSQFGPLEVRIQAIVGYIGEETLTVAGELLTAQKCKLTITGSIPIAGTAKLEQEISFAPKIGYIAKQVSKTTFPPLFGFPPSGDYRILTSYTLAK